MVIIEISGQEGKIEAFIEMMRPFGIVELARTGRIAMVRGKQNDPENEDLHGRLITDLPDPNHIGADHHARQNLLR